MYILSKAMLSLTYEVEAFQGNERALDSFSFQLLLCICIMLTNSTLVIMVLGMHYIRTPYWSHSHLTISGSNVAVKSSCRDVL